MYLLIRLVSTFQTTYITTGHPNTRIDFVWFRAEYCLSFLSHLVFSPAASLLVLHWLVSLWVCLSSPGWSFVDPGDQVRWEVLETVPHLRKKEMFNAGNWFLSLIHSFLSFFLKLNSQQIWYPGGRSLMFAREILPLSPSSNSTITLPSFSSSPGPPTAQHTQEGGHELLECISVCVQSEAVGVSRSPRWTYPG